MALGIPIALASNLRAGGTNCCWDRRIVLAFSHLFAADDVMTEVPEQDFSYVTDTEIERIQA